MANTRNLADLSRTSWLPGSVSETGYPGDENIKLGCLQRIADATELMAQRHQDLAAERDTYKSLYESVRDDREYQWRVIAGLRGAITRLKKKVK